MENLFLDLHHKKIMSSFTLPHPKDGAVKSKPRAAPLKNEISSYLQNMAASINNCPKPISSLTSSSSKNIDKDEILLLLPFD